MDPLLELDNVVKHFPIRRGILRREVASVKAVDGVSFSIGPKEVHALVGESGSGKSTVGRLVVDLIKPTRGVIKFKGIELNQIENTLQFHRSLQMIFQDPLSSLNPRFTIKDAIFGALNHHHLIDTKQPIEPVIEEILFSVGLGSEIMHRYPHQLSGGQQQRACIGRAICLRPELLICDEAVSALDVSVQAQVLNLLSRLQQDLTLSYLFISHDLETVRHFSDRVTVMYLGKVMETGKTVDVFQYPKHPYTQALLASIPTKKPRKGEHSERFILQGEIPSPINPPSGCPFRTRCPFAQEECKNPPPKKTGPGENHSYFCILD